MAHSEGFFEGFLEKFKLSLLNVKVYPHFTNDRLSKSILSSNVLFGGPVKICGMDIKWGRDELDWVAPSSAPQLFLRLLFAEYHYPFLEALPELVNVVVEYFLYFDETDVSRPLKA